MAPNAGQDMEQQELSNSLFKGMKNGNCHFEQVWQFFYEAKHSLTI
jgi:hypothetical protein